MKRRAGDSDALRSAIYEGSVSHRRLGPRRHDFRYRLFMLYLDLEELPELFNGRWFWSTGRRNLAWFRREDYLGPAHQPLREAVLDRVEGETGRRPTGAVRMLSHLRTFGYVFNPVTFYYCFDEGEQLAAVVAEITNTPWGERHAYVLDVSRSKRDEGGDGLRWSFPKRFHVSPFFDMDQTYSWRFGLPGEALEVNMTNFERGDTVFHANLECERREINSRNLAAMLLLHPLLTLRVPLAIYWQAARLWWKRTPFFPHPDKRDPDAKPQELRS